MARPRSDISARILHAARERFLHDGVDGASLRRIAQGARTNIGMVYYYYPTKDDLFLAVVEETYTGLLADLAALLSPDAPIPERLERLYGRLASLTDEEFTVVRIVVREALVSSSRLGSLVDRFSRGHLPLVLGTILEGVASGELTPRHHPAVLAAASFGLGIAPQVVRRLVGSRIPPGLGIPEPKELAKALTDVLMHGIATPRGEAAASHDRPRAPAGAGGAHASPRAPRSVAARNASSKRAGRKR